MYRYEERMRYSTRAAIRKALDSALFVSALGLLISASGCNRATPDLVPVGGRVTMDDHPVSEMVVNFRPIGATAGSGALGATDTNGEFHMTDVRGGDGVHPGSYKVYFYPASSNANRDDPSAMVAPPKNSKLPRVYLDMSRTPLIATIPPTGGKVTIHIADREQDSTVEVARPAE